MAFGKRGATASSAQLSRRIAATTAGSSGIVPVKPTAYDSRKQAAILAKAASDESDARYLKIAVAVVVAAVVVAGLFKLAGLFLFVPAAKV
jgi:hypothetical protein